MQAAATGARSWHVPGGTKRAAGCINMPTAQVQGRNAWRFSSRRHCALGVSCGIAFNLAQNGHPTGFVGRRGLMLRRANARTNRPGGQLSRASTRATLCGHERFAIFQIDPQLLTINPDCGGDRKTCDHRHDRSLSPAQSDSNADQKKAKQRPTRKDDPLGFEHCLFRLSVRDPLNRASRDAEPSGDLMKAWPSRSRQSVTDSLFHLGGCTRAPEGFRHTTKKDWDRNTPA
jgi:hypothetical protein